MNVAALRNLHQARPFVPFTLSLADGRKIYVKHNDYLAIAPTGRHAVMTHDDDSITIIVLNLVLAVDVGGTRASPAS